MLEDLAAMEKYMSESYDGRTFVELLQNADDAESNRVKVFLIDDTLVVANDGRPFNKEDVMAICRSGASNKRRGENIGYRGVGFKSATTISTEIVIYSASVYFTFSKSVCAKALGLKEDQVPTVRIPFLYDQNKLGSKITKAIEKYKKDGFSTFFIFKQANAKKFFQELDGFNAGWLIFLKHISEVNIESQLFKKSCALKRKKLSDTEILLKVNGGNNQWYIVSDNNVSIAFKYDIVEGILPCGIEEAVFHCFLPTLDKTGFPFKVNADFSTDPSRKHIIQDENTNKAIISIQNLYTNIVFNIMHKKDELFYPVLSLLSTHTTLNPLVTQLESGLLEKLRLSEWVQLYNGQYVTPENVKIFPKWLDSSERNLILTNIPSLVCNMPNIAFIEKTNNIELFLNKLGAAELTIRELSVVLINVDYVQRFPAPLIGKIFVYYYRAISLDKRMLDNIFIPLSKGSITLAETSSETNIHPEFISTTMSLLTAKEIESLAIFYPVFSSFQRKKVKTLKPLMKQNNQDNHTIEKSTQLAITRWKTPIQNCMAIEALNGNTVKNIGAKSDEYNVISTDENGNTFYITVKTVGLIGDSFTLTESEYRAAQHLGSSYKIYVFYKENNSIKYNIIANPISTVRMKKIVKEWEWVCESYNFAHSNKSENTDYVSLPSNSPDEINFDKLDGAQFEHFCAQLLMRNNYEDLSLTKPSRDQGVDIIAYKDNIKYGIQCKCYSSDIGNSAVQEVFSGKNFYKCNIGIVLTNQHFTSSAIQLAESSGIVLWDRNMLLKLIKGADKSKEKYESFNAPFL